MTIITTNFYLLAGTVWQDISSDVSSTLNAYIKYGFGTNRPDDRVASTGQLTFTLNNFNGVYTPNSDVANPYFKKGQLFKVTFSLNGKTQPKFRGYISSIYVNPKNQTVDVTVLDFINFLATTRIPTDKSLIFDKTSYDVAWNILTAVADSTNKFYPAQDISTGTVNFPVVFDNLNPYSTAIGEMNKIAMSELCYIYEKRDPVYGARIVVENRFTRDASNPLSYFPTDHNTGLWTLEDGTTYVTDESGNQLAFDGVQDAIFISDMLDLETDYSDSEYNNVIAISYPRKIDNSVKTLYRLNEPFYLNPYESVWFDLTFTDPSTGLACDARYPIQPQYLTDYIYNSSKDGFGTNQGLYAVAAFTSSGGRLNVQDYTGTGGWVLFLQIRGSIVQKNALPIETVATDTTSVQQNGYLDLTLDMPYLHYPAIAESTANWMLSKTKNPKYNLTKVHFLANSSEDLANAFLYLDMGDLIYISEPNFSNIINSYYIHGIEISIVPGGNVYFSWMVIDPPSDVSFSKLDIDNLDGFILAY